MDHRARRHPLKLFGLLAMLAFVLTVVVSDEAPPALEGEGLGVTLALVAFVAGVALSVPWSDIPDRRRILGLVLIGAATCALAALQPDGGGFGGVYIVVVVAAAWLPLRPAAVLSGLSLLGVLVAFALWREDAAGNIVGLLFSVTPWFFVMRLLRQVHRRREQAETLVEELEASRAAQVEAAALAERGRLARDMHDVLAHSLSALALQLEGARLLARDRDADPEVIAAVERAHHLAADGLDEARAAIGALRGEAMPGPERLRALAEGFGERCRLTVTGEPRPLASEARLAIYRTAQEALTNAARHADPDRVELRLAYEADGTRLVVEDSGGRVAVHAGAASGRRLRHHGHARARRAARRPAGRRPDAARLPRRAVAAGVSPVRVLLADDQRVVREGLGTLLGLLEGIELVATAADGAEAVELARRHDPDVVLMDLRMPRVDGIEAIRRLAALGERPRAIALTTYADDASVLGALRAGARGYLTKDAGAEEIRAAVEAVARGEAALDPSVQHHVVAALAGDEPAAGRELPDELTPREAEVLALIAAGRTNAEIAEALVVSAATVKSHINHIFAKTGVRDRAQAVVYAYEQGLATSTRER
jgi:DNA-binding NarL/FixJ family response regulator/signal transduction histidine kinase